MMNNAKKIKGIGELLLVLGGILYVIEMIGFIDMSLILPISVVYAVSVVLLAIAWFGTRDERRAAKAEKVKAKQAT